MSFCSIYCVRASPVLGRQTQKASAGNAFCSFFAGSAAGIFDCNNRSSDAWILLVEGARVRCLKGLLSCN